MQTKKVQLTEMVNILTFGGKQYIVPSKVKEILQCTRGFLWFEIIKNKSTKTARIVDWTGQKTMLQSKSPYIMPVRVKTSGSLLLKTYLPEFKVPSEKMPIIDCRL
jgi:hypothetical protein